MQNEFDKNIRRIAILLFIVSVASQAVGIAVQSTLVAIATELIAVVAIVWGAHKIKGK